MPLPAETPVLTGNESFLTLVDEVTWGDYPDPEDVVEIHVPVDVYDVEQINENRAAQPYVGERQRYHTRNHRGMPQGPTTSMLFGWRQAGQTKSLAQHLIEFGFAGPNTRFRSSKSGNWYEGGGVSSQRHCGLRVNQATLAGQSGGALTIALDLLGRIQYGSDVVGAAPAIPFDRKKLIEFDFSDVVLDLAGQNGVDFGGFSLVTNHNLEVDYFNSKIPMTMPAGDTIETLQLEIPKTSNIWDETIRAIDEGEEVAASLRMKGLHRGTGEEDTEWCQITAALGRLALTGAKTGRGRNILRQPLQFNILKPQSNGVNNIVWTFEDVA
jgi:hypothetical protein